MKYRSALIAGMASLFIVAGIAGPEAKQEAPPKKAAPEAAQCTRAPGSHIRLAKPQDCEKAARGPYRSFSKDELDSTGETDLGEALRKLDPRFR